MFKAKLEGWNRLGRPFRSLLVSDGLTLLSTMVGYVAVPWWIAHEGGATHIALYASLLAAVAFFSLPLLSPLGDRVSKRLLLTLGLVALLVESLLLASMAQGGVYRIEWIILLGVLQQVAMAVMTPVTMSIAAEMLPPEQLNEGLGYQRTAQALGRLFGPVAGGALLAVGSTATALWVNAGLLALACLLASRIELPMSVRASRSVASWMTDLRAGLAAKWKIPTERGWSFVSFLVLIFFVPSVGMLVPLKVQSLSLSGAWLGACEAGLSVGMLVGSLGGSMWVAEKVGRFRASFGAILCEGVTLVLLGLTHQPWVMVLAFTLIGACVMTVVTVGHTHRMLAIPQHFRARMSAVNLMVAQVGAVIGPGLAGASLAVFHVDQVYMACGVGLFLVALGYQWVPGYRRFLNLSHDEAAGFYGREHPALFDAGARREPS
ncbi:MAG: MFS transporter [Rhizobacter sp.]|nr:MFS transporter [Rhizobacter sp.]